MMNRNTFEVILPSAQNFNVFELLRLSAGFGYQGMGCGADTFPGELLGG